MRGRSAVALPSRTLTLLAVLALSLIIVAGCAQPFSASVDWKPKTPQ